MADVVVVARPAARVDSPATPWNWAHRHAFWLVALAPAIAHAIGTVFNIWYNRTHVRPLLTDDQFHHFLWGIIVYNGVVYPLATATWLWVMVSLWRKLKSLRVSAIPANCATAGVA